MMLSIEGRWRPPRGLTDATFVTTDSVFTEVLAYVAGRGTAARAVAVDLVDAVVTDPSTFVVRQGPELFDAGLDLYRHRLDKDYSLTDCISMIVCRREGISDVLTHDHHFSQEGFRILL